MSLIGYARVSTEDQTPLPQSEALKAAGCTTIHEEHASGGNRARPVLARVLERVGKGDRLVVVRIDRLARSPSHLLEVIERLEATGRSATAQVIDTRVTEAGRRHPGKRLERRRPENRLPLPSDMKYRRKALRGVTTAARVAGLQNY